MQEGCEIFLVHEGVGLDQQLTMLADAWARDGDATSETSGVIRFGSMEHSVSLVFKVRKLTKFGDRPSLGQGPAEQIELDVVGFRLAHPAREGWEASIVGFRDNGDIAKTIWRVDRESGRIVYWHAPHGDDHQITVTVPVRTPVS